LRKADGLMVGGATLQPLAGVSGAEMEIGWRLRRDCWGQGYASEAASRIRDYAQECGISRLIAVAHPDNAASIAVMRRIGMHFRGLETHYKTTCATWEWSA
jgi:RimJ/RimL family protein N-acetyltransferase